LTGLYPEYTGRKVCVRPVRRGEGSGVKENVSAAKLFVLLLVRPSAGVNRILREKPGFKGIVFFLLGIGTLRGMAEGVWILSMQGRLGQVLSAPPLLKAYLLQGLPFVLSNVTTAYVRWAAFAVVPFLCGVFFGGRGRFEDFLRIYGVALGIFLVTIMPNFAYLFVKLPVIRFNVSEVYNPTIGIGQVLTSCWLVYVSYRAVMVVHKLPRFESFFAGLLVPLLNIGILVLGAAVVFNFPSLALFSQKKVFSLSTAGFTVATLMVVPVFLWLGYAVDKRIHVRLAGSKETSHSNR